MHVIGNWKLNGNATLVDTMAPALNQVAANCPAVSVVTCPPDIWIGYLQGAMGYDSPVATGGRPATAKPAAPTQAKAAQRTWLRLDVVMSF